MFGIVDRIVSFVCGDPVVVIEDEETRIHRQVIAGTSRSWSQEPEAPHGGDVIAQYAYVEFVDGEREHEIRYYLGNMTGDTAEQVVLELWLSELHELSHWAEDELTDHTEVPGRRWNSVLIDAMRHCQD